MKILFINNIGTAHGGAETMITQLRRELLQEGHEVKILAGNEQGNGEEVADKKFRTFRDDSPLKIFYVFNPFAVAALRQTLREFHPDIVHLHATSKASPFILALLKKYPTVLTIHDHTLLDPTRLMDIPSIVQYEKSLSGYFIDKPSLRFYLEKLRFAALRHWAKNVNTTLVCSDFYRKCTTESGIFQNPQTLHNGIKLLPEVPIKNWKNILFVGRLDEEKGAHILIEAARYIKQKNPDICINIAGDGKERGNLRKKVENLGLADSVRFLGHQPPDRLLKLYQDATILVVPSLYPDNLPTVCIEAMSVGRPIVASNVGGIPELVADGKTGILVPPNNPKILAEKINELLQNKSLMLEIQQAAREKAEEEFETTIYIKKTIQEYIKIINKKV